MTNRMRRMLLAPVVAGLALGLTASVSLAQEKTRVSIGVTETMETANPYGDSVALLYGIWTEITGPLCKYNWQKARWEPGLAKSWKVEDPNNWVFVLDQEYKFNDGSPVTAEDVVHSLKRVLTDPQSKQKASVARPVKEAAAVDEFTVRITTKKPTAPLLDFLCDGLIITSKATFDKYGAKEADKNHMMGGGPYALAELVPGQRMVIEKRPDHPAAKQNPNAPDEIVFRVMREPEQRVAALMNNEVQIAQFIPPHLYKTVDSSPNHKIVPHRLHRDHVPGHAAQAALRQEGNPPGGVPRHRPGQDHQDPAPGPGQPSRRSSGSGAVGLQPEPEDPLYL